MSDSFSAKQEGKLSILYDGLQRIESTLNVILKSIVSNEDNIASKPMVTEADDFHCSCILNKIEKITGVIQSVEKIATNIEVDLKLLV